MDKRLEMLKELTSVPGITGFEGQVKEVIRKHMEPVAEISEDNLGSIICKKTGTAEGPRIMLSGHMDEIGFMVKLISEDGFIKFTQLGGWWDQVLLAQRVTIMTKEGPVPGIIGSKPPHILSSEVRNKVVKKKDMFIDIGAEDREDARKMGVRPGDPIIPKADFTIMKNEKYLLSKAWDDRIGCALFMDVINELAEEGHPNTLYGVGSVQEEVGLRGAKTSAELVDPDIMFALEVGIAGDVPGVKEEEAQERLGKGPVILLYDASMVPHLALRDFVIDTADELGIEYQFDLMEGGGTDAGRVHVHKSGVPSLVISVPTRYIHSHYGLINRDDYDQTVKLLKGIIKKLDQDTVNRIRG
ncbi:MAG: M42 family metallopeptidase [Halanaerobium sp.]|nr:M42 family metallopeptidase [Halanaerobium sp.]